ncbi:unnamed protein product, partial [Adineta ricciae]
MEDAKLIEINENGLNKSENHEENGRKESDDSLFNFEDDDEDNKHDDDNQYKCSL